MWPFNVKSKRRFTANLAPGAPAEVRELLAMLDRLRDRCRNPESIQLRPCLSEEKISLFESFYGVQLPEEYRNFVKYAGDGGIGPDFGIFPLRDTVPVGHEAFPPSILPDEAAKCIPLLATPFPYTAEVTEEQFQDTDESDPFWDHFLSVRGCLQIVESGCGRGYLLVVNGPAAGTIWIRGDDGFYPEGVKFYDWYRCWLEAAIKDC